MKKANGGDGITVALIQILKDDAKKVLHSVCQRIWKTAVAVRLEKVNFHSNQRKAMLKNVQTTAQLYSSHTLAK